MRIFNNAEDAEKSNQTKEIVMLNGECPTSSKEKFCGNWCALFYANKKDDRVNYVILGCKGTDKKLFIESVNDNE